MLIAALGVGLFTAYYFGVQAGIWAAAVAAGLLIAAMVPGLSLYAYAALIVGVGIVAVVGPRRAKKTPVAGYVGLAKGMAQRALAQLRKKDDGKPQPRRRSRY